MNRPGPSGDTLILRSVPWPMFARCFDLTADLFKGDTIDVLARNGSSGTGDLRARFFFYPDSQENLTVAGIRQYGFAPDSYERVVVCCYADSSAGYANLAEVAFYLARSTIVFIFGGERFVRWDLPSGPPSDGKSSAECRRRYYDFVYQEYPRNSDETLQRQVNYLNSVRPPALSTPTKIDGTLLIYNHPLDLNASSLISNIMAFSSHSAHRIWELNAWLGYPDLLDDLRFDAIILHFSLFAPRIYLSERFRRYLKNTKAYKVVLYQDEYCFLPERVRIVNDCGIDTIYTHFDTAYHDEVYRSKSCVRKIICYLPGYVPNDLMEVGARFGLPQEVRGIDVGYRAMRLPYWLGRGAQEKHEIAERFVRECRRLNPAMNLDIDSEISSRIYGDDWFRFLGNCKGVLGVESGASLVDPTDSARRLCEDLLQKKPGISFEETYRTILYRWDGKIPYRAISPRHFEAAALRTCQILFEGRYSGVLRPMEHYIPLKKDFSNLEEVFKTFLSPSDRNRIVESAFSDLIQSRKYDYGSFVASVDRDIDDELNGNSRAPQEAHNRSRG